MLNNDYFIERQHALINNPYAQASALLGIRESSVPNMGIAPLELKGYLALIGERAFAPSSIRPHTALVINVEQLGFSQAI